MSISLPFSPFLALLTAGLVAAMLAASWVGAGRALRRLLPEPEHIENKEDMGE